MTSQPSRPRLGHVFRTLEAPGAARALLKLADRTRQEDWSFERFAAAAEPTS